MSPARAQQALSTIAGHAERYGREHAPDRNALMVWCGLGDTASHARSLVGPVMAGLYKTPFDRFERYTPCGTPAEVAEAIAPFVEMGFQDILLNGLAEDAATLIALSDEVGQHLATA